LFCSFFLFLATRTVATGLFGWALIYFILFRFRFMDWLPWSRLKRGTGREHVVAVPKWTSTSHLKSLQWSRCVVQVCAVNYAGRPQIGKVQRN